MRKKLISVILACSLFGTLLSGCGSTGVDNTSSVMAGQAESTGSTSDAGTDGKKIVIARHLDSEGLDPVMTASNVDIWVLNMMIEGLVGSSDDGSEIIPAVADKWEVSEDYLTYTFHIRDGIKFADGNPVTADDVIYSLTRARDEEGPWVGMLDMMEKIEDGGDGTVVISLKEPSPAFLSTLAMFYCGILEKSYCEEAGEEGLTEKPMGTGPFVLSEWDKGEKMIFTKNENYWEEGCPKVDEIDMVVVADDSTRIMQLESGQIDAVTEVPYARLEELESYGGLTVNLFDSTDVLFLLINCQGTYGSDKKIRNALSLATDKKAINDAVYYGKGTLAETFLAPALPYSDQDLPETKVDIEKAKALLSEAGFPDGFEITVQVGSGDSAVLQTATILQQQWAEIGVKLNIEQIDLATARQNWKDGNYDVYISDMTSDMTDTSELAGLVTVYDQAHCWRTYWDDEDQKAAEKLTLEANTEMDEKKRAEDYTKMQEIMADAKPLIPLVYMPFSFVASEKVTGYAQNPLGVYNFKNMTSER